MLKPNAAVRKKFLAEEELELIRQLHGESEDAYDEDVVNWEIRQREKKKKEVKKRNDDDTDDFDLED